MPILNVDPPDWRNASTVQVDSSASDNMSAIREIDAWAADNGFQRVNEYWLRQVKLREGPRIFRGVCYRITEEELESRARLNEEVAVRVERMPVTPGSPAE